MPVNYGHHRSDRIHDVLNPSFGIRDELLRRGIKPHDHTKDNRMKIKALEKVNRERKEAAAAAQAAQARPSPRRYAGVESRVAANLSRPATADASLPPRTPPEPRNFSCPKPQGPAGRIFTAWEAPPLLTSGREPLPPRAKMKPAVPRREPPPPPAAEVDFVKRNADLSALTPRKAAAAAPPSPPGTGGKSKYHGRLPPYLLDRKLELAKVAADAAAATAPRECPPGTRILAEAERLEVLALVKAGQVKVHAELDKMPFVVDSYGLRVKHEALIKQLNQLDAAETAFSRKKVIVALDDHKANVLGGRLDAAAAARVAPPPLVEAAEDAPAVAAAVVADAVAAAVAEAEVAAIPTVVPPVAADGPIEVTDV